MWHQPVGNIEVGCHTVIDDWMICFAAYTAVENPNAFQRAGQPPKLLAPFQRDLNPISYRVPWAHPSQPPERHFHQFSRFFQDTSVWPTQTDTQTNCSSTDHTYAMYAVQPNNITCSRSTIPYNFIDMVIGVIASDLGPGFPPQIKVKYTSICIAHHRNYL